MDGTEVQGDVTLQPDVKETPDVAKIARDAKASALADVGRQTAEANKATKAAEAAGKRIEQMLKDYEEDIRDDPDKLSTFRARQERQKADSELTRVELELSDANDRLKLIDEGKVKSTMERNAREVATRLEVEPERLVRLASHTDGTTQAIEDIAKDLPKVVSSELLVPDSNRSAGGNQSEKQTVENWQNNLSDPTAKAAYMALRRKKGI